MDHRYDVRIPVELNVSLFREGIEFGNYQSTNLGYGGLFLEACSDVVDEGDFVVAKIENDVDGIDDQYPMKAIAVHRTASGIGLMWVDCSIEFYDRLNYLIKQAA